MSDASLPEAGPSRALTAGAALRAAREASGMTLETLATSLKVSQRKIELLETDRFDELPGAAFVRALALSVCRALKIDSESVMSRLPRPEEQDLDSVTMGLNAPFKDHGARASNNGLRGLVNLPIAAAAVLVVGAAAVYFLPALRPQAGQLAAMNPAGGPTTAAFSTTTTSTTAPMATTVAAQGAAAQLSPPSQTSQPSPAPQAGAAVADASAGAASSVVDTVFSSPAVAIDGPVAGGMLMLRAAAESWIEVRDGAGRILLSRSLAPGEAAGLDGSLPLRVVVGNAEATQVTFRGQPVTLAATRDNVARLELK